MIKKIAKYILCAAPVLTVFAGSVSSAYADNLNVEGQFHIERTATGLQITPQLKANKNVTLRYKIKINKCGSAGTSNHGNGGSVKLMSGEQHSVGSTITFPNFTDQDHVAMKLSVYQNKQSILEFKQDYPDSNHCGSKG
ncbi:MAG: curli-like amyloid fiber formation chaperone CsgH [Ghiorsea sp.]